eukprot:scaffold38982_cov20-Prasinocladus_malaysianus.AAC.1
MAVNDLPMANTSVELDKSSLICSVLGMSAVKSTRWAKPMVWVSDCGSIAEPCNPCGTLIGEDEQGK